MATPKTSAGEIEVGIAAGTVRNGLTAADSPQPSDETAEVHVETGFGDIVIRRA